MFRVKLMGPSIVKKYGYLFESAFHPRSIRRGPCAAPQMGVLLSLGSQMVRGWYADGTRMERGWNADGTRIQEDNHIF